MPVGLWMENTWPPRSQPNQVLSTTYNYKCFFSVVILALVDANYQFLWADVGRVGSQSDGQIYNVSELADVLQSGEINLPGDAPLPNDDRPHPFFFFLADDAFALKSNMHDEALLSQELFSGREDSQLQNIPWKTGC